jgi:hypothetical protein
LLDWHYPEATLLQYVDDLLRCGDTEPLISRVMDSFLSFLVLWGYKVSKEKIQLCLAQVTYLGTILKGMTHRLRHEQMDPILHFPFPQTIQQFRAFLGVIGFCRICSPRYAALPRPIFMLLLIFLIGPCIINAPSRFVSQQVQWIKLQLLVKEYSPLPMHELSIHSIGGPKTSPTTPITPLPHC